MITLHSFGSPGSTVGSSNGIDGLSVFLNVGARPFKLASSDIYFRYVDESPSMDNMVADIDLKESLFSTSFQLGAQYEMPQGIFFKLLLDGYLGQTKGLSANLGIGYSIGKKKFHFRPQVQFSYGGHGLKLGDLFQNDVYIEVNGTQFYSESVAVKLKSRHFVFTPQVEIVFDVADNFEILAGGGYNVAISDGNPFLQFSGDDRGEESVSETESISVSNVFLRYNGEVVSSNFIELNGAAFHLGFAYKF